MTRPTTLAAIDNSAFALEPGEIDGTSPRRLSPTRAQQLLRELGDDTWVRNEAGNVVRWPASEPLRPGCTVVDPVGVDAVIGEYEGVSYTRRDAIHHELQHQLATDVALLPYETGRVLYDGGDRIVETADDRQLTTPTGARNLSAMDLMTEGLKR